jgi:hypothetical protein
MDENRDLYSVYPTRRWLSSSVPCVGSSARIRAIVGAGSRPEQPWPMFGAKTQRRNFKGGKH